MTPKRIQRKRTRGWSMPYNTVYVGRPTKWGNPFKIGQKIKGEDIGISSSEVLLDNIDKVILAYRFYLDNTKDGETIKQDSIQLKGKNLACWCKEGESCHADVLLEIANRHAVWL